MKTMKTIQEIRRTNARKLRDGVGGNTYFANMIDREPTQTSRFMGKVPPRVLVTLWLDTSKNVSTYLKVG